MGEEEILIVEKAPEDKSTYEIGSTGTKDDAPLLNEEGIISFYNAKEGKYENE